MVYFSMGENMGQPKFDVSSNDAKSCKLCKTKSPDQELEDPSVINWNLSEFSKLLDSNECELLGSGDLLEEETAVQ